jgi:hypothetical protein
MGGTGKCTQPTCCDTPTLSRDAGQGPFTHSYRRKAAVLMPLHGRSPLKGGPPLPDRSNLSLRHHIVWILTEEGEERRGEERGEEDQLSFGSCEQVAIRGCARSAFLYSRCQHC